MFATGPTLAGAMRTFGALPVARMIHTFQDPELRNHPGVGLNDLWQTDRIGYRYP